jgi:hypothetical protein
MSCRKKNGYSNIRNMLLVEVQNEKGQEVGEREGREERYRFYGLAKIFWISMVPRRGLGGSG